MGRRQSIVAAVLAGSVLLASAPLNATPMAGSPATLKSDAASNVIEVRYYGHGRHGNNGAGIAAGIIGGAILGGIIASQQPYYYGGPAYYGPGPGYYGYAAPYGGGNGYAYCASRYRSFDPASGTYLGYDGYRHPCQ